MSFKVDPPEKINKTWKTNNKKDKYIQLRKKNISKEDSAKLVGYSKSYTYKIEKIIEKQLVSPRSVRLACKTKQEIMEMKPTEIYLDEYVDKNGDVQKLKGYIYPKVSDRNSASDSILDRASPKVQKVESKSVELVITADIRQQAKEILCRYGMKGFIEQDSVDLPERAGPDEQLLED